LAGFQNHRGCHRPRPARFPARGRRWEVPRLSHSTTQTGSRARDSTPARTCRPCPHQAQAFGRVVGKNCPRVDSPLPSAMGLPSSRDKVRPSSVRAHQFGANASIRHAGPRGRNCPIACAVGRAQWASSSCAALPGIAANISSGPTGFDSRSLRGPRTTACDVIAIEGPYDVHWAVSCLAEGVRIAWRQ